MSCLIGCIINRTGLLVMEPNSSRLGLRCHSLSRCQPTPDSLRIHQRYYIGFSPDIGLVSKHSNRNHFSRTSIGLISIGLISISPIGIGLIGISLTTHTANSDLERKHRLLLNCNWSLAQIDLNLGQSIGCCNSHLVDSFAPHLVVLDIDFTAKFVRRYQSKLKPQALVQ